MSRSVLPPDLRRVEECAVGDEVRDEAEDIDGWEVDGRAAGGLPPEVEDGLGIEGEGPAEGVDPAEGGGG